MAERSRPRPGTVSAESAASESQAAGKGSRDRLALALDVDDLEQARRLAVELCPWFGVVKVGLELFSAAGPQAVTVLADLGVEVFLDLKLADIPTTVRRAARVLGSVGVSYLTVHASTGLDTLRAGVEGLEAGAAAAGLTTPKILAVTVLTSEIGDPRADVVERAERAVSAGCGGVVCAAEDLPAVHRVGPRLMTAVPGIRPSGAAADDQRRTATPAEAWAAGADLLIVGRPVTAASDRKAAAASISASLG
jgi:orotidine-5'-phosphate decarboxylase